MAWKISDFSELRSYLNGVIERADHHANAAGYVVFSLIGAILYYADEDVPIEVRATRDSLATANQLRIHIQSQRYVLSWSHEKNKIVVKQKNQQGKELAAFDSNSSHEDVRKFFESLKNTQPR